MLRLRAYSCDRLPAATVARAATAAAFIESITAESNNCGGGGDATQKKTGRWENTLSLKKRN